MSVSINGSRSFFFSSSWNALKQLSKPRDPTESTISNPLQYVFMKIFAFALFSSPLSVQALPSRSCLAYTYLMLQQQFSLLNCTSLWRSI
jgi:hypothetical protein